MLLYTVNPTVANTVLTSQTPPVTAFSSQHSLERDEQQRTKFKLLSREEQEAVEAQSMITQRELYQETKKVRKAWNTPAERPGTLPKPPPRVSLEEVRVCEERGDAQR